ncbi:MAG: DNA-directed RNA polymerase subunit alpha [Candidatus Daviesbacteria bacterium]|nr:DNA-directed RNA polymerase subunit alpha [Candidatus Daviesbacteria bacterium]
MFKLVTDFENENTARFFLEPLEVGFGHTLGNAIRRVLLSSLEGSAITSVKIDSVSHQFSTIEGISEDVIEIILNIKKIRVRVSGDKPIKLFLKANGKKEVTAKDIEVEGDGEVINKDAHIATLNDAKAKLSIEMTAERGKGYSKSEDRKTTEIGSMSIDALFSPVVTVNYGVEPTRVGRRTDFDKLILDITTDGTIKPLEAVEQAARILSASFKQVYEPVVVEEAAEEDGKSVSDEVLKLTVDELDLPVRITNALRAIEVNTVEDLINISRQQLLKAKNLGSKSLSLISEKLTERGLSLREA